MNKYNRMIKEKLRTYNKGDYIKSIVKENNNNYFIRLLEKPTIIDGDLVCKVSVKYNTKDGFIPYAGEFYILENEDWTSEKILYMNTALYKLLYKESLRDE